MFAKSIAVAGVAGLALGFTGLAGSAIAAGAPQNGTHGCANIKAQAAHLRKQEREANAAVVVARDTLVKAENAHHGRGPAVKAAKAALRTAKAEQADAQDAADAATQKRHNCANPQPTGGTDSAEPTGTDSGTQSGTDDNGDGDGTTVDGATTTPTVDGSGTTTTSAG